MKTDFEALGLVSPAEMPAMGADEVAQLFGCCPKHIRDCANRGELPGFRVGRCWRFSRAKIYELMGIDCGGADAQD